MKTRSCRCCDGSGNELDDVAVGKEMRKLRESAGLTLKAMGAKMNPKLNSTYIFDLEHGHRRWNLRLVEQYRKVCL